MNRGRKFLTIEYVCQKCGWSSRIKTLVPKNQERHAVFYRQAIAPEDCLRCRQIKQLEECICCKGRGE